MASRKKQRKAAHLSRKERQIQAGPFRHRDGDRRHRGQMTYEEGLAQKQAMQQLGADRSDASEEEE
jgi:hypothetical protein